MAAGSAPRAMMLADLDDVLRTLLERELAASQIAGVAITFDAPSRERSAEWPSPALDLFLYDIREASHGRDRSWQQLRVDDREMLVRPPVKLDCTYAITAWTQSTADEHQLLSQVIAILAAYPLLAVDDLPPSLRVGDPPVPLRTALAHTREEGRAEFWTAVGGQYKVSVEFTVTVLCDPGVQLPRGPAVERRVVTAGDMRTGVEEPVYPDGGAPADDAA